MASASEIRFRRGDTSAHSTFLGPEGEVTYNTVTKRLHTHDGQTIGGNALALIDDLSPLESKASAHATFETKVSANSTFAKITDIPTLVGGGPILPTGGTVSQTLNNKLSEIISVKDYGAVGDGVTDDTAAIQAAIDYAETARFTTIFFPSGRYRTTATLIVNASLEIKGAGQNVTNIYSTHSGDCIVFAPPQAGVAKVFLSGCGISDISITRTSATNGGSGIWLRQVNGFECVNVTSNNHDFGFRVTGGQLNKFVNCTSFASEPYTGNILSDSAGWVFENADLGAVGVQYCYTVDCTSCNVSSNKRRRFGILIKSVDGLNWRGGYFAFAQTSHLRFAREAATDYITAVQIDGVYFDCVDDSDNTVDGTPIAIQFPERVIAGQSARNIKIQNCMIANNDGDTDGIISVRKYVDRLSLINNNIANTGSVGIDINDDEVGTTAGTYIIKGNTFSNTNNFAVAAGCIKATGARYLIIDGNTFEDTGDTHILLAGNIDKCSIVGNIGDATLVSKGLATITDYLEWNPESLGGGTFTPTVSFGGGANGVTFSENSGRFTRAGNVVTFRITITFTSKGTSTGEFRIRNLPFSCDVSTPVTVTATNLTANTMDKHLMAETVGSSDQLRLFEVGSVATDVKVLLSNTQLQDNTSIWLSGTYFTDDNWD